MQLTFSGKGKRHCMSYLALVSASSLENPAAPRLSVFSDVAADM